MRTVTQRAAAGLALVCLLFTAAVAAVGLTAVFGVRANTRVANDIATDELTTSVATADLGRLLDHAVVAAQSILFDDPSTSAAALGTLEDDLLPQLETGVAGLVTLHAGDPAAEQAGVRHFATDWRQLRVVLNGVRPTPDKALVEAEVRSLDAAYQPLDDEIGRLLAKEQQDAATGRAETAASAGDTTVTVAIAVGLVALGAVAVAWWGRRALRRAIEPTQEQVEFGETLQLAKDEDETRRLLQRYLERSIPDSTAVVLNRNNSADRLEAMTALPPGSPLVRSLRNAEPDACLAIRSGKAHREVEGREALMACAVCSGCDGNAICTPLTVGGEVIGSVLTNRAARYDDQDARRLRDSIAQAAPVLANLRNLALAEFRAATDSLTGLPNKRAVADTIKRMFAQATRTHADLSLLMLDIDHFKRINDTFGHAVGDLALANVGAAIRSALRATDFAGRNGGEEFCIVLPDTSSDAALELAEKVRAAIAEIAVPGVDVRITASIGLATFPLHAGSPERLERLADSALYLAKRSGRDRTEIVRVDDGETPAATDGAAAVSLRRTTAPHVAHSAEVQRRSDHAAR
ncbi:MAG: diguanylate cyclase [Jatrophihabitans sp.]|uniref:GGDEF domain-containing protein n=1 Tax=Jatrophihabitans sp. TaxID=1932789 RepID=UPI003F7D0236